MRICCHLQMIDDIFVLRSRALFSMRMKLQLISFGALHSDRYQHK